MFINAVNILNFRGNTTCKIKPEAGDKVERSYYEWQGYKNKDVFVKTSKPGATKIKFGTTMGSDTKTTREHRFFIEHDIENKAKQRYIEAVKKYLARANSTEITNKDTRPESLYAENTYFDIDDQKDKEIFVANMRNDKGQEFPSIRYYFVTDTDGEYVDDTLDVNPQF